MRIPIIYMINLLFFFNKKRHIFLNKNISFFNDTWKFHEIDYTGTAPVERIKMFHKLREDF